MNTEAGQLYLLGCDFVDSALVSLTESWEQHIAALQNSIIDICNRELRRSEIPSHLATPSGKRKRRFTSAQKAIQALLNNASTNSSSSISSSQGSVARVTRARAKKGIQDTSSNSSFEQQGKTGQNSSVTENNKGKRKGKGKAQKDDEGFVKPLEPITKSERGDNSLRPSSSSSSSSLSPAQPSSVVKKEKDEVDNKVLSREINISIPVSPISKPVIKNEEYDENDDPICWNVKRITSPPKKGKFSGPQITISNHDKVMTPVENNINKQPSPEDAPPDSEWTTDDESFESIESIGDETYQRMTGKKSPNSSHKLTTVKKQKRKQTEYFTPSIPHKSTRVTRATANKIEITPKIDSLTKSNLKLNAKASSVSKSSNKLLSAEKLSGATTSGSSIASSQATIASVGRSDSVKGKRTGPRTCTTPDTKALTASAAKRRLEEEEKRKATLAQMREKEEKVLQSKQENLKMKAQLTKLKNEEKRKKMEQIRKKEEEELKEKRQKEQSKLEEIEKRRKEKEEARRREMLRNQEAAKRKQIEFDQRKQQEEEERKARLLKQEEQNRQKKEEFERIRLQQEKILRMIAQHNSNLQKGQNTSATQQKVDQPASVSQFKQPLPPTPSEAQPALPMNRTFSVDKEGELVKKEGPPPTKVESYQITPPPKHKPTPVNYDISDIKSDDDTDDEERPRKQIPSWAKGDALIAALDKQFAKSRRARERQIREIFPCYDFSIELTDIFKSSRVVHPKYDKRTSSAVWSSPPCNSTINCSMLTE